MLDQVSAFDWLKNANVGARTPGDVRLEYIAALATKELIWRHEKLCEAVMGVLTDMDPSTMNMSQDEYRQLLREQVALALTGVFKP